MAQSVVAVRMDDELKKDFDNICGELGITMSTAVIMLAKKMTREKRLPFELSIDPFYSEANMKALGESMAQANRGEVHTFTWDEFEKMARESENG